MLSGIGVVLMLPGDRLAGDGSEQERAKEE
jgi:hypothetical protein